MDERLKKALDFSNYMVTLNNQRLALKEKFLADLVYYHNGGCFTISKELINFVKTMIDTGNDTNLILIDDKDYPVEIENVNDFLSKIINLYFTASNSYHTEYQKIKSNRSVEGLVQ